MDTKNVNTHNAHLLSKKVNIYTQVDKQKDIFIERAVHKLELIGYYLKGRRRRRRS